jgi:hypothetical protein
MGEALMSDDNEKPQIVVPATPVPDQIEAGIRAVFLVIGAVSALAGFVSKHDIAGLVAFMQSSEFVSALGFAMAAAAFLRGQWKARHRSRQLTAIASSPKVPDSVATVAAK